MNKNLNEIIEALRSNKTKGLSELLKNTEVFHLKKLVVINKRTGAVITIDNVNELVNEVEY